MANEKGAEIGRQSIDTQAARQLATTTKTVPQMVGVTPRWLLRLLPWVNVESGTYRVNRKKIVQKDAARLRPQMVDGEAKVTGEDLQRMPLFRTTDPGLLAKLAAKFKAQRQVPGDTLCKEGETGDKFYIIAKGKVEASTTGPHGERLRIAVLHDGDYFGEIALLRGTPRTATATCLTSTTLLALSKADFDQMIKQAPQVRQEIERAVEERMRMLAEVNEAGEEHLQAASSSTGEGELPEVYVDYETEPREFPLHVIQTIVRVHTRVSDIYNQPINQLREQIRLAIEGIKERQEWEVLNNAGFGLLNQADPMMRIPARKGPPTPDDMDELLARVWKKPAFFLAHPRAIAAFGRECTRRGVPPPTVNLFGSPLITWRGVPIVPSDKLEISGGGRGALLGTTNILLMRVGEQEQGVVGLHQTGIPGEQMPSLSVRFMGINRKAVASYLITQYFSAAALTPDSLGVLENVQVGFYHEYA